MILRMVSYNHNLEIIKLIVPSNKNKLVFIKWNIIIRHIIKIIQGSVTYHLKEHQLLMNSIILMIDSQCKLKNLDLITKIAIDNMECSNSNNLCRSKE